MLYADIALPLPLHQLFTYAIPNGMMPQLGHRVLVPVGRRRSVGFIMALHNTKPTFPTREIIELMDITAIFSEPLLALSKWMSQYYASPIGELCRAMLPAPFSKSGGKIIGNPRKEPEEHHTTKHILKNISLLPEQQHAINIISEFISAAQFSPVLLHGITGSGKTEIYLELFAKAISMGKQAIFLVPEIGLTPQLTGRVISRFPNIVAIYHSGLTESQKLSQWCKIREGEAQIVVGTRSALFAPFRNLGVIIIDEEHDSSYKQEENPRYHARDCGLMRAKHENIPIVLGSATPALETMNNAKKKKYHYIPLTQRAMGATLPKIKIVDMRNELKHDSAAFYLSQSLVDEITATLDKKLQTILFLNRRGFATFMICSDCGTSPTCPNCSITLTLHRHPDMLKCHYCDFEIPAPSLCPTCKSEKIRPLGLGTQRLESELKEIFPAAAIARLDRDTSQSSNNRLKILTGMKNRAIDILIGTQMITKGHDFSHVALVGIISADTSLHIPDFRASERTFQLLTQTAGRSGRGEYHGKVIIQTLAPTHYSIQAALTHDYHSFYETEINHRQELNYPPFSRLALLRIQGNHESRVISFSQQVANRLQGDSSVTVLGPAPAPIAKLRGKFRWHILLKSATASSLGRSLQSIQKYQQENCPSGVQFTIDVDPSTMM